jgi:phage-related protein
MASIYEIDNFVAGSSSYVKNDIVLCGPCGNAEQDSGRYFYYTGPDSTYAPTPGNSAQTVWGGYTTYNNAVIPHFFWVPDYGTSVSSEPKVEVIQFGDGYEQRAPQNISADLLKVDVTFDNRDEKEVTAMAHFLHTRGAKDAFAFTPPSPYGSMKKFVCRSWDINMNFHNNFSLKASFEEVVS